MRFNNQYWSAISVAFVCIWSSLGAITTARGQAITWNGQAGDSMWNSGGNWDLATPPTSNNDVTMAPNAIVILTGNPGTTNDLSLNGPLDINSTLPGVNLTVNGAGAVGSGTEGSITVGALQGSTAALDFKKSVVLGTGQGGVGTLNILKSNASFNVTGSLLLGQSGGKGSVLQKGAGTIGDNVFVGDDSGEKSTYTFDGATPDTTLQVTKALIVGRYANGDFTHTQGTLRADTLFVGAGDAERAREATYTFSTGNISITNNEIVGDDYATGTFTQQGDSTQHIVRKSLIIGKKGIFQLNSGTLHVEENLTIGNCFEQRKQGEKSEVTINGDLTIENGAAPYKLIAGELRTRGKADLRQGIEIKQGGKWIHNGQEMKGQAPGNVNIEAGGQLELAAASLTIDTIPVLNAGTVTQRGAVQLAGSAVLQTAGTWESDGDWSLTGIGSVSL